MKTTPPPLHLPAEILAIHPFPGEPPPLGGWTGGQTASYPVMPVGLVALMNLLQGEGHQVLGLNLPVCRMVDPGFTLDAWLSGRPAVRLVLLDLHWYEHAVGVVHTARVVRRAWPETRIVVGGLTATRFGLELLAACPEIDLVVAGDAEEPLRQLAAGAPLEEIPNLLRRGAPPGPSWRTPPELFDDLDTGSLDWLLHARAYRRLLYSSPRRGGPAPPDQREAQWIANGRGCAHACLYCGGGRGSHRQLSGLPKLMRRSPEAVLREVRHLRAEQVSQVALTLDPDMLGRTWREAFFGGLEDRPGLYLESFQLPSVALLDAMATRGDPEHSELALSPLSGDVGVRARNGKSWENGALLEALRLMGERGLSAPVFFSLNLPGEDAHTLSATIDLSRRILDQDRRGLVRIMNICHSLDPASPLSDEPALQGGVEIGTRSLADYLAHGRAPRPWTFREGERGFAVPGRDLPVMVARWDALCAQDPERLIAVPRC